MIMNALERLKSWTIDDEEIKCLDEIEEVIKKFINLSDRMGSMWDYKCLCSDLGYKNSKCINCTKKEIMELDIVKSIIDKDLNNV